MEENQNGKEWKTAENSGKHRPCPHGEKALHVKQRYMFNKPLTTAIFKVVILFQSPVFAAFGVCSRHLS
jgi:hypothetical protein